MRTKLSAYGKATFVNDFSFAVMTDSHLRLDAEAGDYWNKNLWGLSADVLAAAVDAINALSVDFAVHCGDLTDRSDSASCRRAPRGSGAVAP